jgi:hypothetical protein
VNFSLNLFMDVKLIRRQQIYICLSVDGEFQFGLSRTDPSKEFERYFVISNFLEKLKLIIPLQQFLQGMKKVYIADPVASFSLSLIILHHKMQQP